MNDALLPLLTRIAEALERISPPNNALVDLNSANAFIWQPENETLRAVTEVSRVPLALLQGVDHQREILLANTLQFARGNPANNALLWGARGMGKSALVKAIHAHINSDKAHALALIELHREDLENLPHLLRLLKKSTRRFIVFCDDLSFSAGETSYKSLKAVLEGGLEGRPDNVLFYATSNRRHLMPRDMIDNEQSTAINPSEAVEEKVSLSDRFGLWIGFHACDQATFFAIIDHYANWLGLKVPAADLRAAAIEWSVTRGGRSGRVAWQFIQDVAGKNGAALPFK